MQTEYVLLDSCENRYVALDGRDSREWDWSKVARAMSAHPSRGGVGSDGIVLLLHSEIADVKTRIFNPDGSEAEMSGNGIRLLSKFALDRNYVTEPPQAGYVSIETRDGVKNVWPEMEHGKMVGARVGMGPATFEASQVPVNTDYLDARSQVIASPVTIGGIDLVLTCLAIGNPHAVAILDEPVEDFPLVGIGPLVERHPMFPNRINFEIVNDHARDRIQARIFERGAGETPSSGTGSTASAFACRKLGLVDDCVDVQLDGGTLTITWDDFGNAFCTGPAHEIESGIWDLERNRQLMFA